MRSTWSETDEIERPAFKIYRFRKGAWPEMILGAVMGASRHIDLGAARHADDYAHGPAVRTGANGHATPPPLPPAASNGVEPAPFRVEEPDFGRYRPRHDAHAPLVNGAAHLASANGHDLDGDSGEPPILIGEAHADPRTGDGAEPQTGIEAERIADRFGRPRNGA